MVCEKKKQLVGHDYIWPRSYNIAVHQHSFGIKIVPTLRFDSCIPPKDFVSTNYNIKYSHLHFKSFRQEYSVSQKFAPLI